MPHPRDGLTTRPSLTTALQRLVRARAHERWTRVALWLWCGVLLLWMLPIGPWSATALRPVTAAVTGSLLLSAGALLARLHQVVTRPEVVRPAMNEALRAAPALTTDRPARWHVPARAEMATTVIATSLLWAGPVLHELTSLGWAGDWLWLLYPIAGLIVAARWRLRGALTGAGVSLMLFFGMEGLRDDWSDLRDPSTGSFLRVNVLLMAAIPLVVGLFAERTARAEGVRRSTEDQLRATQGAEEALRSSEGRFRSLVQNAWT